MTPVELNFDDSGPPDAPPLLMGGSLGTTLAMWEPQLGALTGAARVVRFEHRGHGGSPVPAGPYTIDDLGGDVVALMDRLGIERASYCGLSIGGMVGQWLAINAPERVDRVILICTAAYLPPAEAWSDRAAAVRAAGSPEVVADGVLGRWFTPAYAEREPGTVARYRQMICSIAAEGYAGCCEAIAAMDLTGDLPSIQAPTLVLAGDQDPSTPPPYGEQIAGLIPGARFEIVSPAAHLATVERPDLTTAMILRFLSDE